ncbi:hypothetical protein RM844_18420 [Streptomyces sp. DSM 44915]|uniref:Flp pilus assembly protein RcpC/CpaB domain-containing protein n=1 Tax=Streptomyces chisholmiae TaxID=3075540 RepID=A0ABU2JTF1_9ACTN|nr:hypothetical protein [Streptomyces sp. DSM 44915]MDT0268262.1 hypothetical protein [Streptomyces sp. DSM 44915]
MSHFTSSETPRISPAGRSLRRAGRPAAPGRSAARAPAAPGPRGPAGAAGGGPLGVPSFAPIRPRAGRRSRWRPGRRGRLLAGAAAVGVAALSLLWAPGAEPPEPEAEALVSDGAGGGASAPDGTAGPPAEAAEERTVALPLRIADPASVRLLEPGDRVDVYAAGAVGEPAPSGAGAARLVASGVRVAEVPEPGRAAGSAGGVEGLGGQLVVSVDAATAAELTGAAAGFRLAVARW